MISALRTSLLSWLRPKVRSSTKYTGLTAVQTIILPKPFGMMEMVSRVKAVLRRYVKEDKSSELTNGSITMDIARHMVFCKRRRSCADL